MLIRATSLYNPIPLWVRNEFGPAASRVTCAADFSIGSQWAQGVGPQSLNSFIACVRNSPELAQWADGHWSSFPANTPAITDLGLWSWQASTNLVLYSNNLTGAGWSGLTSGLGLNPTVTANYAAAPDGTQTASRVQFNLNGGTTSSDLSAINANPAITNGLSYSSSYFIRTTDGSTKNVLYYDVNGTAYTAVLSGVWQRFAASVVSTSVNGRTRIGILGNTPTPATDILVWGCQPEQNAFATPPIITTGAPAPRAADVITAQGALASAALAAKAAFAQTNFLAGTTSNSRIVTYGSDAAGIYAGVGTTATMFTPNLVATLGSGTFLGQVKLAAGFDGAGRWLRANGGAPATDANPWGGSGAVYIGNNASGSRAFNGSIQRLAFGQASTQMFMGLTG